MPPALGLFLAPLAADMAERRHERFAQRRRDRFMRQVVDASPDPILTISRTGTILSCNGRRWWCDWRLEVGSGGAGGGTPVRPFARRSAIPYPSVSCRRPGRAGRGHGAERRGATMSLELAVGKLDGGSVILIRREMPAARRRSPAGAGAGRQRSVAAGGSSPRQEQPARDLGNDSPGEIGPDRRPGRWSACRSFRIACWCWDASTSNLPGRAI